MLYFCCLRYRLKSRAGKTDDYRIYDNLFCCGRKYVAGIVFSAIGLACAIGSLIFLCIGMVFSQFIPSMIRYWG